MKQSRRGILARLTVFAVATMLIALRGSAQLEREWSTFYASQEGVIPASPVKVVADPAGGYYVVARATYEFLVNASYAIVARYDANGALMWRRVQSDWGMLDNLTPVDAACNAEGHLIVACDAGIPNRYDAALVVVNRSGNLLWYRREVTTPSDRALCVAVAPNGNIYLGRNAPSTMPALLCYSATGNLLWQLQNNTLTRVYSIVFAPDGVAFVGGEYLWGLNYRFACAAVETNGAIQWLHQTSSSESGTVVLMYDPNQQRLHGVRIPSAGSVHYFRFDAVSGTRQLNIALNELEISNFSVPPRGFIARFSSHQVLVGVSDNWKIVLINQDGSLQTLSLSYYYYLLEAAPGDYWFLGTGATLNGEVRRLDAQWTQQWVWTSPFQFGRVWSLAPAPDGHLGALMRTTTYQPPREIHRSALGVLTPTGNLLALNTLDDLPGRSDLLIKLEARRHTLYLSTSDRVLKYGAVPQPEWTLSVPNYRDFAVDWTNGAIYVAARLSANQLQVTRYNLEGTQIWTTTVPIFADIAQFMVLPSGDVLLFTSSSGTGFSGAIARLSPTGQVLNNLNLGNKRVEQAALSPDGQQLYVVIDDSASNSGFDLAIYNLSLQLIRSVSFGFEHAYYFVGNWAHLSVTNDSVYLAAGLSGVYYLLRLDQNGNLQARYPIPIPRSSPTFNFVTRDSEGRYYLVNTSSGNRAITCFNETGTILWEYLTSDYSLNRVAVREQANQVFVSASLPRSTGAELGGNIRADARLLILNRQTGQLLAVQEENLPEALSSISTKLAFTPRRLWSAGYAVRALTGEDVLLHCYRLARGGDVDGNGCVDDADLLQVLFAFGSQGANLDADLNEDGIVDDADLLEVLFAFGQGCG